MATTRKTTTAEPRPRAFNPDVDSPPPQNIDAEKCLLGACLLLPAVLDDLTSEQHLMPSHFYADQHQKIFAVILGMYESGETVIEPVSVCEELNRRGWLEEIGGLSYIHELIEAVPHAAHAGYYANLVIGKDRQRQTIYACTEGLRSAANPSLDIEDTLSRLEEDVFRIRETASSSHLSSIGDVLLDAFAVMESGDRRGIPTGFGELDAMTMGLCGGDVLILAARPSVGKTAAASNIALNAARGGRRVLFVSLEQPKVQLAERWLSSASKVDGNRIRGGRLDEADRHHLMQVAQELNRLPVLIDDRPGQRISQIIATARSEKRRRGLDLVVIDYLQLVEPDETRGVPREQQVSTISRTIKSRLAKGLNLPVIVLAQLNRDLEKGSGGVPRKPRVSDLRESGSIEQDADMVGLLWRPDLAQVDAGQFKRTDASLILGKNRSGPVGEIKLLWQAEFTLFEPPPLDDFGPEQNGFDFQE